MVTGSAKVVEGSDAAVFHMRMYFEKELAHGIVQEEIK
jgi:hypothetical protein